MGVIPSTPLSASRSSAWPIEGLKTHKANLDADDLLRSLSPGLSGSEAIAVAATKLARSLSQDDTSTGSPVAETNYSQKVRDYYELLEHGYMELPSHPRPEYCKTGYCYIHPVLGKSTWERLSMDQQAFDLAYERMRPALALVTRLLLVEEGQSWWLHVLNGRIEQETSGKRRWYIAPGEQNRNLHATLMDLSSKLRFVWMNEPGSMGTTFKNPYRALKSMDMERWKMQARAHFDDDSPVIGLSPVYLYHLLKPLSNAENLRLQLGLATTIGHELAHAFYHHVHGVKQKEVYYKPTDIMPEMGFSWEEHAFGCLLAFKYSKRSVIGPICASSLENYFARPSICKAMSMEWVEKWFRLDTWLVDKLKTKLPKTQPVESYDHPVDHWGLFWADRWNPGLKRFENTLYTRIGIYHAGVTETGPDTSTPKRRRQSATPLLSIRDWWLGARNNPSHCGMRDREIQRALAAGYPKEKIRLGRPDSYRNQCYDVTVQQATHVTGGPGISAPPVDIPLQSTQSSTLLDPYTAPLPTYDGAGTESESENASPFV